MRSEHPVSHPLHNVSPIKYMAGTSKSKFVLGLPGWRKLGIKYDAVENHISLMETENWDFIGADYVE